MWRPGINLPGLQQTLWTLSSVLFSVKCATCWPKPLGLPHYCYTIYSLTFNISKVNTKLSLYVAWRCNRTLATHLQSFLNLRSSNSDFYFPWCDTVTGFTITHTPHSVGIFWTCDQPDAETSTWQGTILTTDIHAKGGIRTRNPSKWAAADPRLRPRGHWDVQMNVNGPPLSLRPVT